MTGARRSAATRCECAYPWVPLAACRKHAHDSAGLQKLVGVFNEAKHEPRLVELRHRLSENVTPRALVRLTASSHLAVSHLALSHLALSHLACPSSPVPLLLRWLSSISPLPTVRQAALRHWAASLPPLHAHSQRTNACSADQPSTELRNDCHVVERRLACRCRT